MATDLDTLELAWLKDQLGWSNLVAVTLQDARYMFFGVLGTAFPNAVTTGGDSTMDRAAAT